MEELTAIIFIVDSETGKHIDSVATTYSQLDATKALIKEEWQRVQKKSKKILTNFADYLFQLYPVTLGRANNQNKEYQAYCTVLVDA